MEIIACQSYKTERIYPSRTFCLDIIIFAYFSIIIFSIIIFFIQEGRFKADFPQYPLLTIYLWKILHYKYYVVVYVVLYTRPIWSSCFLYSFPVVRI